MFVHARVIKPNARVNLCSTLGLHYTFCLLSAVEVKEHPFFKGIDWQQVYLQKVRTGSLLFFFRNVNEVRIYEVSLYFESLLHLEW